ncbi:MAG: cytochrome c3 family protein, partial [Pseudomonadota bacterium]
DVADHPIMALDNYRCAACHKEHVGGEAPIEQASVVCTDCHENLKELSPKTDLMNVSDFGANHPQFRPTLVTGVATAEDGSIVPTTDRRPLDQPFPLVEKSGLKFPHDVHLDKKGVRGLGRASDKTWEMNCASCHVAQADGMLMRPIEMERDCAYCHELTFKPDNLDVLRELPHAKAVEVSEIVHDYYSARALEGRLDLPGAPDAARRRPGSDGADLTPQQRDTALAFASQAAERELRAIMEVRLCGDCHVAQAEAEPDARGRTVWKVQGALLQRHWMPKSRFNHEPHFAMDCVSCHEATTSKASTDVLMPDIENCRDCHKGEQTSEASASSGCLACHGFHLEKYGPMAPDHGAAFTARRNEAERSTVVRTDQ